jgi:hypothetical protein
MLSPRIFYFLILTTSLTLAGCGSLLPHGEDKVISQWKQFKDVKADYDKVIPYQSKREDLDELGFTPEKSPNVRILNHFEILNRVAPHNAVGRADLPTGLLKCLHAEDGCQAYEVKLVVTENKRYGGFLADFFNFRRKVQITGWAFNAVFVLQNGLVVYKVWNGTPQIEEYRDTVNPLGPLQGIGSDVAKPSVSY